MNKTAIKNFAVWARQKLISDITYKAGMIGVTESGIADKLPQSTADLYFYDVGTKNYAEISGAEIKQREALVNAIKTREKSFKNYKEAFENVIEEVAYTWFNRMIAIRFMEVNDYLPSGVRVLSSENKAKKEPDLVTAPFDSDLEFTSYEHDRIIRLKDDNKLDELFRMLFIKQCNKLHDILPELFEKTDDYSELLLTISFTDPEGIIHHLINDIEDVDFRINDEMYTDNGKIKADGQVEIIGWLYQYYISKKHDEIVNIYKGTVKKADIPAATQLFTTDWVVRYMVDNSLGRYWIERNPQSKLAEKLEFFVTPKNGEIQYVDEKISPTDLTFFDPCMGSGHILVYAFDVLMEIYREVGYSDRDAAVSIVENNLFGMDIDKRAYQLAYFAVMMKARSYNRRALTKGISNNLAVVEESNSIDIFACNGLTTDSEQNKIGEYLVAAYRDAQEIGTLQTIEKKDYKEFVKYLNNIESSVGQIDLFSTAWLNDTLPQMVQLAKQAEIMSNKYAVVCTNPPYMNKLEGQLKKFVVDNYKAYSGDLFSVFIYRNFNYCKVDGYSAFMTPFVWMFIKTYETLRTYIIDTKAITTLVQMEYSAFEEATVPICSFALKNGKATEKALCFRLSDFKGGMEVQKQKVLEALADKSCGYYYETDQTNFSKIPGSPIAYWWKNYSIFDMNIISNNYESAGRNKTHDNIRYVRNWWEISNLTKWQPYANGGAFRRWAGNDLDVVDWSDEAKSSYASHGGLYNQKYNGMRGICWNLITSYKNGFRLKHEKHHYSSGSPTIISKNVNMDYYVLAFLNSVVSTSALSMYNPTLNTTVNDVLNLPLIISKENTIEELSKKSTELSQRDWDSFETSWDFKKSPLLCYGISICSGAGDYQPSGNGPIISIGSKIDDTHYLLFEKNSSKKCFHLDTTYDLWKKACEERFLKLKANEEELNRIFIDIYGLNDELTPDVADKDITVHRVYDSKDDVPESMKGSNYVRTLHDEIVSLVSYAVGCMFGRYSLDVDGLAYAGGEWDESKYKTFIPDMDNCIPITEEEYFEDDIVGLFCAWLKKVYGEDTLEENLDFIAKALGNKGKTSREVIRSYFLNDFMKDHIKTYQKRPIYWLFDSGKQNGFKALVYMHRWDADTIGNVRVEYLHRIQRVYEKEIIRMQEIIDNSHDNKEISNATKRKEKLQKQIKETKDYDAKIAHLALSRIDIDLDDGVKVNYEKVQTADGKKMQILAKI